jgi:hypothetical protein
LAGIRRCQSAIADTLYRRVADQRGRFNFLDYLKKKMNYEAFRRGLLVDGKAGGGVMGPSGAKSYSGVLVAYFI